MIAVVIPLHNGAAYVRQCLRALLAQQGVSFQILVVENGSADTGPEIVAAEFPSVGLLRFDQPLGFAGAVNAGLRTLLDPPEPPETVVLLNQDTEVDPGWLAALLSPFDDPQVGVVGSLSRYADGSIQHAGGELLAPLWYGRNLTTLGQGAPDYVAGLATALRVTMLRQIGLFDETFHPAYFEDVDLCLRARATGWELRIASEATLLHHEGAVGAGYAHAATIERNRLRLLLKHADLAELRGPILAAEHEQLEARAAEGTSQLLRQAYMSALLALPAIGVDRGWSSVERAAVASDLAALRSAATAVERGSRMGGLLLDPPDAPPAEQPVALAPPAPTDEQPIRPPFIIGERPPVAIIVLTWNGLAVTKTCLESLRAKTTGVDYRIIVVDNGSTDGTLEWLRAQPDLTLIANSENLGFTRGNNQGIAVVPPGHDVLLLNNDTEIIQEHWLSHMRDVANSHPDYGIVGCLLLNTDRSLQHAGTYMPLNDFWGYQVGAGEAFIGQFPGVREVEGITGACMYIRRDLLAAVGLLDEAYFSYYEDTDYCLRAVQAGYKIVCTGGTQLVHHENTSTRLNNANWWQMFSNGQRTFLRKWRATYSRRYTRALFWHSLIAQATGYATSSREFVLELDRRRVDIRLACIFGTDYTEPLTRDPRVDQMRNRPKDTALTQVVYSQADAFIKNSGRYKVGFTMLESDALPSDWTNQSNQMDEVWVPASFTREVFCDSGVRRPIHVVPLGFNPDYFHPGIAGRKPAGRFVFLSNFEWIERKGPELLLRAYVEEFRDSDDVVLVLKVFNHDPYFDIHRHVHELTRRPGAPRVAMLLNQNIAPHQVGSLYRSADCFVLPTRGEGWGMPILEAMACGIPAIATDWGAQRDFFHAGVGYPLRLRGLIDAVARSPYYAGSRWADPDVEHLRYLMRYVYEHPAEARAIGATAAQEAHAHWTWAHATDKIMERLEAIGS